MLTGDLIRVRTQKSALLPRFLDPTDEAVLEDARWLVALVQDGVLRAETRGALEDAVASEAQVRPDHKALKGLAKVLFDRAEFDIEAPIDPSTLRLQVFKAAAESGPLALHPDPLGRVTADDVLARLAEQLDLTPEQIRAGLYADRKQEHRIIECTLLDGAFTPEALVRRYNTALVQSVLLKATDVTVTLPDPPAARVRQLLRYVKFHQLCFKAERTEAGLVLTIDGPISVLSRSTRYGLKLATFFPAVLLNDRWALDARIQWHKRGRKTLSLDEGSGLVSHYRDRGGYTTREATWFRERFEALDCAWTLEEGAEPIDLGGRAIVMPDFTFRHPDGRVGHLEIVGTWRRAYLERRLSLLERYGPGNLVLAVSNKLVAEPSDVEALDGFDGLVLPFASIVPAAKVRDALNTVGKTP
jgi:predicted nuclease of restriction endonuclease-like RecB superfamily